MLNELFKNAVTVFEELGKEGNYELRAFIDAGADEILSGIENMEEYRRALNTAKLVPREVTDELVMPTAEV